MGAILRSTPPGSPAVTLATAKAHLRVDHSAEDDLITRLLLGACEDAGRECGTGFGSGTYTLTLDDFPGPDYPPSTIAGYRRWSWVWPDKKEVEIRLGVTPVSTVNYVSYYNEAGSQITMDAADYWLAAASGVLAPAAGYWPATQVGRPGAVIVSFAAGLSGSIPPQATDAILLIVGDRYAHRGDGPERKGIPEAARRLLWQLHPGGAV
jgi:hypothetical protein